MSFTKRWLLNTLRCSALATLPSLVFCAEFTPLGDFPGGDFQSAANDVSDDGSIVVGYGNHAEGIEAFRWTEETGMVGLGDFPGGFYRSRAYGVSGDGTIVVGSGSIDGPSIEAFRWSAGDGLEGLGDIGSSGIDSDARDISSDGNVIIGSATGDLGREGFVWTLSTGMMGVGDLEGGRFASSASAVSGNGEVVVGSGYSGTDIIEAFRWTADEGLVGLGDLSGSVVDSGANDVSNDGRVIVGSGTSENGTEAYIWTKERGMSGLGAFPDGEFGSEATGVSGDGQIVVGESTTSTGQEAFIWTEATGMLNLQEVLIEQGISVLQEWESLRNPSISSDGKWIVGYGRNNSGDNEAFRAKIDALEFSINAGLNDAWYNPATDGQGFLISVFPNIQQMFVAWFTFDTERPFEDTPSGIGEPGHRWLVASGPYSDDTATLTIYVSEGGVFDSSIPVPVTDPAGDGTMTIEFADCAEGIVTYDITSAGLSGEIPIQRVANDNIALCEDLVGTGGQ